MQRITTIISLLAGTSALVGCVERRVWIDSNPPGALVWLNDAQVGRTPVDVSITHHGVYDVRLEKEGFEPLMTSADSDGPFWDTVPLDFFVEILPITARCESRWVFTLLPRNDSEVALVDRATTLRDILRGESQPKASSGEDDFKRLQEALQGKAQDPALMPSPVPAEDPVDTPNQDR